MSNKPKTLEDHILQESYFKLIFCASVMLRSPRGLKESDVYTYNNELFFKDGSYYVPLLANNLTGGKSTFTWVTITGVEYKNVNGKLCIEK